MRQIFAIALATFRESIRGQILYSTLFFAASVVLVSALFGSVTIGDQIKVIKDFGLFSISLFGVGFVVIAGAFLLHKELSKKTIFNILSKSVGRGEFIVGKFLGLFVTAVTLVCIMGAALSFFLVPFEGKIDPLLPFAYCSILIELFILCAVVMFFSAIVVTPMLSGLFSFAVFMAGRSVEYIHELVKGVPGLRDSITVPAPLRPIVESIYYILPHLDKINLSDPIVAGDLGNKIGSSIVLWELLLGFAFYAVGYSGILLLLATIIFRRRQFL